VAARISQSLASWGTGEFKRLSIGTFGLVIRRSSKQYFAWQSFIRQLRLYQHLGSARQAGLGHP
jgi:hypothetical protein